MPSIQLPLGRKNWVCFYYHQDGRRGCKSTKTSNKKEAQAICFEIQKLHSRAKSGSITADKALTVVHSVVAEIMENAGTPMESDSVKEFITQWLTSCEHQTAPATSRRYRNVAAAFLEHIGAKAGRPLNSIQPSDIESFRNKQAERLSAVTCNINLKILRAAFGKACKQGHFTRNPAAFVENLSSRERCKRRGFTIPELRQLLAVARGQWETAIAIALYTGLRLSDVANLTWSSIDFNESEIHVETKKTGRVQNTPLAVPLLRHLLTLPRAKPSDPVLSELAGEPSGTLSNRFYRIMTTAGLVPARDGTAKKRGRSVKREMNELGFHSLRHTLTSMLKSAGVSDSICMDIVGHDSPAISRHYGKISPTAKRLALDLMPNVLDV